MIHLTTGSPGAGKTLFTLSWVHKLWQETGRPVCYTSQLRLKGEALSWGWREIDISKWEEEPDGTIFLVDEAQFAFRKTGSTAAPPAWIENLTVHRHKGYDFFLVMQDPKYLHTYLRGLIAAPGWHRHVKRMGGSQVVALLEWESYYPDANEISSGSSASSVTYPALPTAYYDKYESASLHTAKWRVPRALWVAIAGVLVALGLLWFALSWVSRSFDEPATSDGSSTLASSVSSPALAVASAALSAADYLAQRTPRLPDFPHTAPVYDDVVKPVSAPYPAACISMGKRCQCYSQQGTEIATSRDVCLRIVAKGFFVDWDAGGASSRRDVEAAAAPERQARR